MGTQALGHSDTLALGHLSTRALEVLKHWGA